MKVETVDLDPQDGDIAVFCELQQVFDIKLTQADVGDWRTVGDIYDTLVALLADRRDGDRCATAMSFYRVRTALGGRAAAVDRHTPLAPLVGENPRRWRRSIARAMALRMPSFVLTGLGTVALLISIAAVVVLIGAAIARSGTVIIVAVLVTGAAIAMVRADKCRVPEHLRTLGDFAQAVARANLGTLADQGARLRDRDIWDALCAIIADETGVAAADIGPDSYLFGHVLQKERAIG